MNDKIIKKTGVYQERESVSVSYRHIVTTINQY